MSQQTAAAPTSASVRAEYAKIARRARARRGATSGGCRSQDARDNALQARLGELHAAEPDASSARACFDDYPVAELIDYIDWTPFFPTWELTGKFPAILDDDKVGEAARALFADAQAMLKQIVDEKWFTASARRRLLAGECDGDDIVVFGDEARERRSPRCTPCASRWRAREGRANVALADFIAPKEPACRTTSARFAVTAGIGEDAIADASSTPTTTIPRSCSRRWPTAWPKRSPSACTSACARSSGAMRPTRRWPTSELIDEEYRGIRPAPGYPAQPDHTEKATLFQLLDAETRPASS